MISITGLVHVLLVLIVVGLIFWLLWFLIGYVGLPEPFNKLARVVLMVFAVLICIAVLLSLVGVVTFVP